MTVVLLLVLLCLVLVVLLLIALVANEDLAEENRELRARLHPSTRRIHR